MRQRRALLSCIAVIATTVASETSWASGPAFIDLQDAFPQAVDGTYVQALAPTGEVAVGYVDLGSGYSNYAAWWDLTQPGNGGLLPDPPGIVTGTVDAQGISDDTQIISGSALDGTKRVTVLWTDGAAPTVVSGPNWTDNFGLSGDGGVAIGRTQSADLWLASRWTSGNGVQALPPLLAGESPSTALGVSFDGGTIVGVSRGAIPGYIVDLAAWWDASAQVHALPLAWELESRAVAVSSDGRFVVGSGTFGTGLTAVVRWDVSTGEHEFLTRTSDPALNSLLGPPQATALTEDGSVAALVSHEFGPGNGAALWSASKGLRSLKAILENDYGFDLSRWTLSFVSDITLRPDGSIVMVGEGNYTPDPPSSPQRHSFAATIPSFSGSGLHYCDSRWQAPTTLSYPGFTLADDDARPARVAKLVRFNGELYALGRFDRAGGTNVGSAIARWNGNVWSAVGTGLAGARPYALATDGVVFDDGSGPALYVAGSFTIAGGQFANGLARWNGSQWSAVGDPGPADGSAGRMLAVFDDGSGPALYLAGNITNVGGVTVNGLAKWNGQSWSSIGSPDTSNSIYSMAVYDDGSGPALYISGLFDFVDGVPAQRLARWNGTSWAEVGGGLSDVATHMAVFDDGSGPALYLSSVGLMRWDGAKLETVAALSGGHVHGMEVIDDGQGPALMIATTDGTAGASLLRWDGQQLTRLGLPDEGYVGYAAETMLTYDDGAGAAIYVGGDFEYVVSDAEPGYGGIYAGNIARIEPCAAAAADVIFRDGFE